MKAYTLFQTDIWKTKSSRVFCGVFTTYKKAFKAAEENNFFGPDSTADIVECHMEKNRTKRRQAIAKSTVINT